MESDDLCGSFPMQNILWICSQAAEDKKGACAENRALIYL